MSLVKSKNSKPELLVRRLLHKMGYRFRLHRTDLPGRPDIVLPRYGTVILVHGCFWHGHSCKRGNRVPSTNREYWTQKIARNVARDDRNLQALNGLGWNVSIVWECETRDLTSLGARLTRTLRDSER